MPAYVSVMLKILDENNLKYKDDIIKVITPLGFKGTAEYFKENFGLQMSVDEIINLMGKYAYYEYKNNILAKENVKEVLTKLKNEGASLNVLTASPHLTLDVCLKRLELFDLFENVWSCDDFNTTKVNPEIYKAAAKKIGKPVEKILFLDDNYNADKAAKVSGMKVCGVFDKSSAEYENEIRNVSDHYIYNFSELFEI